uniref:Uncharacterized protein n=1 Tax=Pristionchus pacificus TaxID=54126 RepID=A0A2A6CZD4_PRIPA|eukprot:PDM83519.1 hypothetical protein PRIPAC_30006 [Pristionchus pacificus]
MKTRAKIREEEDERAANAAPVRTSTRVTRSNSNANGREAGQSMLQGGSSTGTAGSTAVETVGVTRKRASTSQARKDAATAAAPAAAVATAAHTKQRRVARKDAAASSSTAVTPPVEEEEAAASSSTQPIHIDTTTRRLTRAQHRAANSVSPSIAAHVTDPMEGSDKSKKVVSPGSRTQSGRVTKKGSTSAGAGSSSSTAPTRAATAARRGGAAAAAAAPPAPVANALAAAANRAGTAADARDSPFRIILGMMDDLDGVNLTGTGKQNRFIMVSYEM